MNDKVIFEVLKHNDWYANTDLRDIENNEAIFDLRDMREALAIQKSNIIDIVNEIVRGEKTSIDMLRRELKGEIRKR